MKKEIKYSWFSEPLSPDFLETLEHLTLCHKTKKQFEKTPVVYT